MMKAVRTSETSVDNNFTRPSLMMEAVRTSETSVDNHFTRQYNPEDNSERLVTLLIFMPLVADHRGRVVITPASSSRGPGFKSHTWVRLLWQVLCGILPSQVWNGALCQETNTVPHVSQFIVHKTPFHSTLCIASCWQQQVSVGVHVLLRDFVPCGIMFVIVCN
jgi:hypothetical protein